MLVISNVFGGGMSSRLFQRIREELGLAYAIYSFTSFYRAVGMAGVYVGTQPARAEKAVEAIRGEFAKMAQDGLRGEALEDAKQQTLGQLMLSLESPTARMYRLARTALYSEPYRSLDDVLRTEGNQNGGAPRGARPGGSGIARQRRPHGPGGAGRRPRLGLQRRGVPGGRSGDRAVRRHRLVEGRNDHEGEGADRAGMVAAAQRAGRLHLLPFCGVRTADQGGGQ